MKYSNNVPMDINTSDIEVFCQELLKAIKSTSVGDRSDNEIFGEIYTRLRSNVWYRMRSSSYLREIIGTNMDVMLRNMPDRIKNLSTYIINRALKVETNSSINNIALSIAGMEQSIKDMIEINGMASYINKELSKIETQIQEI